MNCYRQARMYRPRLWESIAEPEPAPTVMVPALRQWLVMYCKAGTWLFGGMHLSGKAARAQARGYRLDGHHVHISRVRAPARSV